MKLRHVLAAASAAALLVGSSYGALAGSWSNSKSGTVVVSHADGLTGSTTFLITGGEANAGGSQAAASYGSWGAGGSAQKTTASQSYSVSYKGASSSSNFSNSSVSFAAGGSSGCASTGKNSPC